MNLESISDEFIDVLRRLGPAGLPVPVMILSEDLEVLRDHSILMRKRPDCVTNPADGLSIREANNLLIASGGKPALRIQARSLLSLGRLAGQQHDLVVHVLLTRSHQESVRQALVDAHRSLHEALQGAMAALDGIGVDTTPLKAWEPVAGHPSLVSDREGLIYVRTEDPETFLGPWQSVVRALSGMKAFAAYIADPDVVTNDKPLPLLEGDFNGHN